MGTNTKNPKEVKGKVCWLAKETDQGWSVWLCLGEHLTFKLTGVRFMSIKDVNRALESGIVFVEAGK